MKKINIKWKYIIGAGIIIIIALLSWFVYNIYHRYNELYRLSGSINTYQEEISLEKIDSNAAQAILDFLNQEDDILNTATLTSPFKPIQIEEEIETTASTTATSTSME